MTEKETKEIFINRLKDLIYFNEISASTIFRAVIEAERDKEKDIQFHKFNPKKK